MGEHLVDTAHSETELRRFTRQLIQDVRALEYMLQHDLFETGIRRVGAEQELFMVDRHSQPAPIVEAVLAENKDPRLVTELTKFNLEFNLEPLLFKGDVMRQMEQQLEDMMNYVRSIVEQFDAELVMTGILPTVHLSDLKYDNITPIPRYYALNDALARLRGGPIEFQISGVDELFVKHDSIMLEGCNTSFQTHFQVAPDEFPSLYNIAQVAAAPVLAAASNSPLLFGKRLWRETRIALFQQAVDTRSSNLYLRQMSPRVQFGTGWVRESVTELFKEDIARFRVLLTAGEVENPFEALSEGRAPQLKALQLHNGTIYRWNRACYGVTEGKPHLRIENRILPAGPTLVDEVANATFWFGLVSGMARRYEDVTQLMEFDDAKDNFMAAAKLGLASQFTWLGGRRVPAHELICEELVPLAREGLSASGIDDGDAKRYLDIIQGRVSSRQNGAQWQIQSLARMKSQGTRAAKLSALVGGMLSRQREGRPVHEWKLASLDNSNVHRSIRHSRVEQYMTTDIFTVNEEELVELVACLMDWQRIRHVLVENEKRELVGIVTHRSLLRFLAGHGSARSGEEGVPVKDIMVKDPVYVSPSTSTFDAIQMMRRHRIGALPVIMEGQLIGIVTERDFFHIAGQMLEREMAPPSLHVKPLPSAADDGTAESEAEPHRPAGAQ